MTTYYWEDFTIGDEIRFGKHVVTEAEMLEFAREFDPQPIYVDPRAAADGPYGGLIASGWQTAGWCMRMLVDNVLVQSSSLGSPGLDSLRWLQPVRAGDSLHVCAKVLASRALKSRPQIGLVRLRFEVRNQSGIEVMNMVTNSMFGRRPEGVDVQVTA